MKAIAVPSGRSCRANPCSERRRRTRRQLIRSSRRAVVFTGAGISTESGIPDFRSPGGIWTKMLPIGFQDYIADPQARRVSWQRRLEMEETWKTVEPNDGHKAVAELVARGKVSHVITQNIDALHQISGVPGGQVIELHGNTRNAKCLDCGMQVPVADILAHFTAHGEAPDCAACGGLDQDRDHLVRPTHAGRRNGARPGREPGLRSDAGAWARPWRYTLRPGSRCWPDAMAPGSRS